MDKFKFIALMLLFVIISLSACSNISDGPANFEKNKPNFERALKKIMDEIEKNN